MLEDKLRTNVRIYGPYLRKDGRKHVLIYTQTTRQTMSYPKWIMEQHLDRFLTMDETIDHIDRDFTNNAIENLQILSKVKHASIDAVRVKDHLRSLVCIRCLTSFVRTYKYINRSAQQGKAGPFCSRRCCGLYGTDVQNNRSEKLKGQSKVVVQYYQKKK